jgi:hypothetical protein
MLIIIYCGTGVMKSMEVMILTSTAPSFKPAVKVWAERSTCMEKRAPSYDPRYEVTDELRRVVDDE